ncbi:MAG: ABC transporter ATP-binding protein [Bacteroidota bacterium]|nr:ABC transporter ATP-binding protein [Bacteroidota bacterium]
MDVIAKNVSKRFTTHWILRSFNYHFKSGTITGISGPNGSGKTTLINILSGIIPVTKGEVLFQNEHKKIKDIDWHQHLTIAAPYASLFEYLKLSELLDFHLSFKSFYQGLDASAFYDITYLTSHKETLIQSFSSGMKQRLKLGLAILSQSDVLFLDEPLSNLDQRARDWYFKLIKEYSTCRTIIIASNEPSDFHFTDEVLRMGSD